MHPTLTQTLILHFVAGHLVWAYAVIFVLLFLEGDALLFGIAFLAHQGFLDFSVLIPLVFFGAVLSDMAWYGIGRRLDRAWPWLHMWLERVISRFDRTLSENPERTLILAKFVYGGVCRALIMRSGALRMPLRRFAAASLQGIIVWMAVVGGLGVLASAGFLQLARYLKFAEIGLALALVIFVVINRLTVRRLEASL